MSTFTLVSIAIVDEVPDVVLFDSDTKTLKLTGPKLRPADAVPEAVTSPDKRFTLELVLIVHSIGMYGEVILPDMFTPGKSKKVK